MKFTSAMKEEIEHEKTFLLGLVEKAKKDRDGKTIVYCVLRHVSRSGMYRAIDSYLSVDGEMLRITYSHALITRNRYDNNHGALGVSGCGVDMGFQVVYELSCALYCPKKYDHESAYKLVHRWL